MEECVEGEEIEKVYASARGPANDLLREGRLLIQTEIRLNLWYRQFQAFSMSAEYFRQDASRQAGWPIGRGNLHDPRPTGRERLPREVKSKP